MSALKTLCNTNKYVSHTGHTSEDSLQCECSCVDRLLSEAFLTLFTAELPHSSCVLSCVAQGEICLYVVRSTMVTTESASRCELYDVIFPPTLVTAITFLRYQYDFQEVPVSQSVSVSEMCALPCFIYSIHFAHKYSKK